MKEVLEDLENNKYKRLMVKSNSLEENEVPEVETDGKKKKMISQKTTFMDNTLSN